MKKIFSVIILSFGATVLSVESASALVSGEDGRVFKVQYNKNGAVLRSKGITIYLGNKCDAYSPEYGKGKWGWANGGIAVDFNSGKGFGFPRQEIDIESCQF